MNPTTVPQKTLGHNSQTMLTILAWSVNSYFDSSSTSATTLKFTIGLN